MLCVVLEKGMTRWIYFTFFISNLSVSITSRTSLSLPISTSYRARPLIYPKMPSPPTNLITVWYHLKLPATMLPPATPQLPDAYEDDWDNLFEIVKAQKGCRSVSWGLREEDKSRAWLITGWQNTPTPFITQLHRNNRPFLPFPPMTETSI